MESPDEPGKKFLSDKSRPMKEANVENDKISLSVRISLTEKTKFGLFFKFLRINSLHYDEY